MHDISLPTLLYRRCFVDIKTDISCVLTLFPHRLLPCTVPILFSSAASETPYNTLKVRQIHRDERFRVFEDVTSQIRRVESSGSAPEITLGASYLELGDVYYRTVASTVLRIANVGQG